MEKAGNSTVLIPDVGWWLAGTKVVQSFLWRKEVLERFVGEKPTSSETACFSEMWGVGEEGGERIIDLLDSDSYVLKREPLGIWSGKESIEGRMRELGRDLGDLVVARDHFWMRKIQPSVTKKEVDFVREGKIYNRSVGIQETGIYVSYEENECERDKDKYSDNEDSFNISISDTVLVRTKPVHEVDGGVCKGI